MRRIFFRGKSVLDNNWVYGNYVCINEEHRLYGSFIDNDKNIVKDYIVVVKDTVGQYTGIRDKRMAMIFEGDIIKNTFGSGYDVEEIVKYDRGGFSPFAVNCWEGTPYVRWEDGIDVCESVEIIGNIYDTKRNIKNGYFY